jgi:hypothetical protein
VLDPTLGPAQLGDEPSALPLRSPDGAGQRAQCDLSVAGPGVPPSFNWTTFDVTSRLPKGWQRDIDTVGAQG